MKKLSLLFLFTLAMASCQTKYPDLENGVYAEIVTNKGTIVAKLYENKTPLTVANFVSLAEGTNEMVDSTYKGKKFYDGLIFHRVIKDFMIQGGDPKGTGSGSPGYKFPDEFDPELTHSGKGVLSMANAGPGTNGSQFFITLKETPHLNNKHTVFGEVVMGQEVVDTIGEVEVTSGNNRPVDPITMQEVNIIRKGAEVPSFSAQMEKLETERLAKEKKMKEMADTRAQELSALEAKAETLDSGLKVLFTEKGDGEKPSIGSQVDVNYAGFLATGELFDTNMLETAKKYDQVNDMRLAANRYQPIPFDYSPEARIIAGFKEGLMMMSVGDKATIFIPSHLGYGPNGYPPVIPPNSDLVFELEILGITAPQGTTHTPANNQN